MRTTKSEDARLLAKLASATDGNVERRMRCALACGVGESAVIKWLDRQRIPRNPRVREALERFLNGGGR